MRWESLNSQNRRDLPTPGSPISAHELAAPPLAWSSDSSELAPWEDRGRQNLVNPRAAAACRRDRTGLAPDQRVNFDRLVNALDGHRAEGLDLDKSFGQDAGPRAS